MDVLSFISADKRVKIQAATAADNGRLWRRFRARVSSIETALTYCDYRSSLPGSLSLAEPSASEPSEVGEPDSTAWPELPPVFYETAVYNFSLQFTGLVEPPSIVHRLKEVQDMFTAVKIGENDWLLAASLDFINEPGVFDLSFRYRPKGEKERTDTLSFRVVSPKLDTKEDYNYILADINREYNDIIYKYLSKTLQTLSLDGKSRNDDVWLSIFREVIDGYIKAVTYIVNRPHLRETRDVRFSKPERIKRWTPQMARLFAERKAEQTLETAYFRHEITENTNNTRENRFVKFTLERISRRLDAIFRQLKAKSEQKGSEIAQSEIAELNNYQSRLRKLAMSPLLRNLRGEPLHSESMVLQKRTGYAQVYRYWLMLQKGIELFEGSNNIGVRPVWELYELWCFLKMRSMVAEILGLDFANPEEIREEPMVMLEPFSDSTAEHTVHYFYGEDEVRLHYQHTFNRRSGEVHTATTDNRPDIVLTVRKPDGFELTYLYDAKYQVTDDDRLSKEDADEISYLNQLGADYPPSDAINQMHRYRDAIYYGQKRNERYDFASKEIIGGYILFPGRGDDESIKKRYYYRSIESVNIGAFPLLPDHTNPAIEGTLLHQHLVQILTAPIAIDLVKGAIPQRGLQYNVADMPAPEDLVLVGYYKTEQLPVIKERMLYYVPAALGKGSINLVSGFEKTKYLLLHHDSDRLLLRLKGDSPKFFPKPALEALGFSPSGDFYLGFEIKRLEPVKDVDPNAYELERSGQHKYTPYFTTFDKLRKFS